MILLGTLNVLWTIAGSLMVQKDHLTNTWSWNTCIIINKFTTTVWKWVRMQQQKMNANNNNINNNRKGNRKEKNSNNNRESNCISYKSRMPVRSQVKIVRTVCKRRLLGIKQSRKKYIFKVKTFICYCLKINDVSK